MRVGVVGLGAIARKAYLPVLATRPDLELHLCTRNTATLAEVGDAYRVPHRHVDLDGLLAAGVDAAFVHAATVAHPALVERLLAAGVHVYVDKPLADTYADAEWLVVQADLETIAQQSDDGISPLRKRARLQQLVLWLETEVMCDVEDVCDEGQVNCTWLQAHVDEGERDRVGVGWCGERTR